MKKILAMSLVAFAAVSTANAAVTSQAYVDETFATKTFVGSLPSGEAALGATSVVGYIDAKAAAAVSGASGDYATAAQGLLADSAVQSVAEGSTNGTIAVDGTDVAVHGLGSAAYTASSTYDAAGTASGVQTAIEGKLDDGATGYDIDAKTLKVQGVNVQTALAAGTNVTFSEPDATTGVVTISTADTTYSTGDGTTAGLTKLYTSTGNNTDGTMTQGAITSALGGKQDTIAAGTYDAYGAASGVKSDIEGKLDDGASGYDIDAKTLKVQGVNVQTALAAGTNVTFSAPDATTGVVTISTADTTYSTGDGTTAGLTKLYTSTGNNTDGTMTQGAITSALGGKQDTIAAGTYVDTVSTSGSGNVVTAVSGNTNGTVTATMGKAIMQVDGVTTNGTHVLTMSRTGEGTGDSPYVYTYGWELISRP